MDTSFCDDMMMEQDGCYTLTVLETQMLVWQGYLIPIFDVILAPGFPTPSILEELRRWWNQEDDLGFVDAHALAPEAVCALADLLRVDHPFDLPDVQYAAKVHALQGVLARLCLRACQAEASATIMRP